ncbi:hypothetical protein Zmor_001612 [Zophobas morio]|uniref:Uncharacterized protein n=1 Tax=Zophobas morio TaxID=2755281 RepID=A0AA38MT28_9CUCU|nr:hypothetical protein Zmor_001612 [Zophobas morio]
MGPKARPKCRLATRKFLQSCSSLPRGAPWVTLNELAHIGIDKNISSSTQLFIFLTTQSDKRDDNHRSFTL